MQTMSDISYERRKAVAGAWKNEKAYVADGKGTRDWSTKEQREILSKGKAAGYQGYHMKSVDGHNSKAGDSNNIQFLTRKEHLAAHNGDFHNNTNGYYDPATGKMNSFGKNRAHVEPRNLSKPLSDSQKKALAAKNADKRAEAAREKAKANVPRTVNKTNSTTHGSTEEKGSVQSKTLAAQRSAKPGEKPVSVTKSKTLTAQRSAKPGEKPASATKSKTLALQRRNSSSTSAGRSASEGKTESSGKNTGNGYSSSSGKSARHGH